MGTRTITGSLPLPAGAATEATLGTLATQATLALIKAKTDNLDALLSTLATAAGQGIGGKTLKTAKFSLSATGTVVAAVASKRIKVYAYKIVVSAAISVKWRDGASTDLEDLQSLGDQRRRVGKHHTARVPLCDVRRQRLGSGDFGDRHGRRPSELFR